MSSKYEVTPLPMAEIFCDSQFNCRGPIDYMECLDLSKDIETNGLDTPISVRPYDKKPPFKYQIVSGHRRFTGFKILKRDEIPCFIRTDLSNDYDAAAFNLRENIQRSDIGLLKEAKRVEYLLKGGYSGRQVWEMLGKTQGWFEPRKRLIELPKDVQDECDKGFITQSHIAALHRYKNDRPKLLELLREIKRKHESGDKVIEVKPEITLADITKARRPKPLELREMRELVARLLTNKLEGHQLYHVALSWCMGEVSIVEMYRCIRKECEKNGLPFEPPEEVKKLVSNL